jgi:hypothetical protein
MLEKSLDKEGKGEVDVQLIVDTMNVKLSTGFT